MPFVRSLVLAIEATLSAAFWAMARHDKDYGYGGACLWPKESFTYKGLCTHSALLEGWRDSEDIGFTAEQMEQTAAVTKERNRLYQYEYGRRLRANPTAAHIATYTRNNLKQRPAVKRRQQEAVAKKLFRCPTCNVNCRDNASLVLHDATPRHIRKVNGDDVLSCEPCGISFGYASGLKQHKKSAAHIRICGRA